MRLTLHAAMHLLVDGVCASTLYLHCAGTADFALLVLLYNSLAFTTQCLVGLVTDRCRGHRYITAVSAGVVALGFLLPLAAPARVILVGLGNSVFHVSGGTETLLASGGRAWKLGVFVAPGSVGLALGTLFPKLGVWFSAALLLACVGAAVLPAAPTPRRMPAGSRSVPTWVSAVLLLTVAVRALGGTAAVFPWKTGVLPVLLTAVFVSGGKLLGGFAMDRLGTKATALVSIVPAAFLIAFGSGSAALSLLGQLLLNLTMPVTLLLLYRAMPDAPGLAFGLAASALWPGTIAGQLLTLTGPALWICVLLCFLAGLWAIWWAAGRMESRTGKSLGEEQK